MNILNTGGTPASMAMYFSLAANEVSDTFTLRYVVDRASKVAAAGALGGVVVKARLAGTTNPFVNIATTVVDLTPYVGDEVDFDFQVVAGATTALISSIRLGYAPLA
ncbi:MAG TPA: hypothetical protein VEX70_10535 [Pyrinomonadaceae bacterium]|nr:hypothetical protein [Pyrinomonadaceae bacterium]